MDRERKKKKELDRKLHKWVTFSTFNCCQCLKIDYTITEYIGRSSLSLKWIDKS